MVRGTIQCDFGEEQRECTIDDADMVFVIGIKELNEHCELQNLTLGGIRASHAVKCLGESVVLQIEKLEEDNPEMAFRLMCMFKDKADEIIMDYMVKNIDAILSGNEAQ